MDIQQVENANPVISMNPETIPEPNTNLKKRKSPKNFFKVALFMMRGRSKKTKVLPVDDESRSIWRKLVGSMRPMHLQSNQSPPQINKEDNQEMAITENPSNENDNIQSEDGFDSASEFPNSPSPASSQYASAEGLSEMVNSPSQASSRYASAVGLSEMVNSQASNQYASTEEKSTVGLSEMVNSPSQTSSRYASAVGLSEMVDLPSRPDSRYASAVGLSEMVEEKEEEEESENENEKEGNGDEMIDAKADEFIAQFYQQMKLQRMDIVDRHYKEISMRSLGI